MNILVFSEAAWNDENSFGNTVSNFFTEMFGNKIPFLIFMPERKCQIIKCLFPIAISLP